MVFNLVPLLIERGLSPPLAAWTLGLGGLGQVLGRLGYRRLAARTAVRTRSVADPRRVRGRHRAARRVLPGPAVALIAVAMLAGRPGGSSP